MHEARELAITLENVNEDIFKVVMEIVYDGYGNVPDDVDEFKSIIDMLYLDSLFIRNKKDQNGNRKDDQIDGNVVEVEEDGEFHGQFITDDDREITELAFSNVLSDTVASYEDTNFTVKAQEINTETFIEQINETLPHTSKANSENIASSDSKPEGMDEADQDIYDYNYEDGSDLSGVSDEYSSDENDEVKQNLNIKDFHSDNTKPLVDISDDEDIIEIKSGEVKNGGKVNQDSHKNGAGSETSNVPSSLLKSNYSGVKLFEQADGNKIVTSYNKTKVDDEILMEDENHDNQLEDTLSEFTSLLKRKNSEAADLGLGKSRMNCDEKLRGKVEFDRNNQIGKEKKQEVEKSDSSENLVYHCPFDNCSYSNKRVVDFHTHIGARHYRTKIQELYPNFIHKHCDKCDKTFSVTSNYYSHMAKHEQFPYMSRADLAQLGRPEFVEEKSFIGGANLNNSFSSKYSKETGNNSNHVATNFTDDDDDDIVVISPPKRKSPSPNRVNIKRQKESFNLNKSM